MLGFSAEEKDRAEEFQERNQELMCWFPLIERNLTKSDCLAMVQDAGIELPAMYLLGYEHNNCIGCVKGGAGYWNKVRRDFPERFEEMASIEDGIGPGAYLMRNRATGVRISLRQLDPEEGRHDVVVPDCGFACARVEKEVCE